MRFTIKTLALVVLVCALILAAFVAGTHYRAGRPMLMSITGTRWASTPSPAAPMGFGSRSFKGLMVTPGPGQVDIFGQAEVVDTRTDVTCRWRLKIKAKEDERVVVKNQDQVTTVLRGQLGQLEFKGTWQLPPGEYQVELTLLEGEQLIEGVSGREEITVK